MWNLPQINGIILQNISFYVAIGIYMQQYSKSNRRQLLGSRKNNYSFKTIVIRDPYRNTIKIGWRKSKQNNIFNTCSEMEHAIVWNTMIEYIFEMSW